MEIDDRVVHSKHIWNSHVRWSAHNHRSSWHSLSCVLIVLFALVLHICTLCVLCHGTVETTFCSKVDDIVEWQLKNTTPDSIWWLLPEHVSYFPLIRAGGTGVASQRAMWEKNEMQSTKIKTASPHRGKNEAEQKGNFTMAGAPLVLSASRYHLLMCPRFSFNTG